MAQQIRARLDTLQDRVEDVLAEVKPKLRGWFHAATAPLALAAGITLIALSPDATTRVGSAVFAVSAPQALDSVFPMGEGFVVAQVVMKQPFSQQTCSECTQNLRRQTDGKLK